MQVKLAALDMYELRKWKKGISYHLGSTIEQKLSKQLKTQRLDDLFERSRSYSMLFNNENSDEEERKSFHQNLFNFLKIKTNMENLTKQLAKWKAILIDVKQKTNKKIVDNKNNKFKSLNKIVNLIEKIILSLEEEIKGFYVKEKLTFDNSSLDIEMQDHSPSNAKHTKDINVIIRELNGIIEDIIYESSKEDFETSTADTSDTQVDLDDSNLNLKPLMLFYDSSEIEVLSSYIEKTFNVENDKILTLPDFDWNKVITTKIDINKDIDSFTKSYIKIFPTIYFNDKNKIDSEILEHEIDIYKNKYVRILRDIENNKVFNLKFGNFTTIQKLILIWGLCIYGNNLNILSELINIFPFSQSITYDNEEIFIKIDKVLQEYNIDFLASNFNNVNMKNSNFYIYYSDPPMLNSTECNFSYNKRMLDYISESKSIVCYEEPVVNLMKQAHHIYSKLFLFENLPIFINPKIKSEVEKAIKEELIKFCSKVEKLNVNNNLKNECLEFLPKAKTTKKQLFSTNTNTSNKNNTAVNKSSSQIMSLLSSSKYDFSVKKYSDEVLDSTKTNIRQDTLEGVSFYSQPSIQKEWENLRTPWYQNNQQFKLKFRKPG